MSAALKTLLTGQLREDKEIESLQLNQYPRNANSS